MALRLWSSEDRDSESKESQAELSEHLGELRARIIRAAVYAIIGMIIMYALFSPINHVLSAPISDTLAELAKKRSPNSLPGGFVFNSFTEPFFLRLQIATVGGLVLAAPLIVLELWGFIAPALTPKEKRGVHYIAPMSVILFVTGAGLAFVIMPMAIRWFLSYLADTPGATLLQNPLTYIVFVVKMMLVFGLVFQLPVILMFLGKVGIISSAMMIKYWRHISVGLFTLAMVVAPSNDPGTMIALAVPLTLLFLGSIWLVKLVEPKQPKGNSPVV